MTASRRLQDKLLLFGAGRAAVSQALWEHPDFRTFYPELLIAAHGVVRAVVHLMETAAEACRALPEDPVARRLGLYLTHHVKEERGHDEWLLQDLEVLGRERDEVLRRLPSPETASLVGAQYYWIHHVHPLAIMGYLASLEWEPSPRSFYEEAADRHRIPREAMRFMARHADEDPHHKAEMVALLDGFGLDARQEALLGLSLLHSCHATEALYRGVLRAHEALAVG